MDIFGIIFAFVYFSFFFLITLNGLYGGGYLICREWWDDDYRRFRKTTFKSRAKGIFLALLITSILHSLFFIFNGKGAWVFGVIFLFFFIARGGDTLD